MTSTLHPSIFSLPHEAASTDSHPTPTSDEQADTEQVISALLATASPIDSPVNPTVLRRGEHNAFISSSLFKLPGGYVMLDASKPWLVFWSFHSLDLLGVTVDPETRTRAVSTVKAFLHSTGGFSGGASNSQIPHLLPTYASTCSLAIVGSSGPGGGWEDLAKHRQATYDFFMRCKRPDGGFVVCQGGELDVRGTYCLLVVATLLDLLTPELLHNVDSFIAACQTYEGGFACSTFPLSSSEDLSPSMAEAHGGYTSCAINSHFLLNSVKPTGNSSLGAEFPKKIDSEEALRWSVMMQGEAIEAGGFRGRSNKLVDGCYSWWVGGGIPVLEALLRKEGPVEEQEIEPSHQLFNNVALQEFALVAAQNEAGGRGGLRDKPGKHPDLYHTCNNLSGLSVAQHHTVHTPTLVESSRKKFDPTKGLPAVKPTTPEGGWKSEEERQAVRREVWANALGWKVLRDEVIGDKENRLNPTTPVFNIGLSRLAPFINYFYGQES